MQRPMARRKELLYGQCRITQILVSDLFFACVSAMRSQFILCRRSIGYFTLKWVDGSIQEAGEARLSQRTDGEFAPSGCCGESPRALGQRVPARECSVGIRLQAVRHFAERCQLAQAVRRNTDMP